MTNDTTTKKRELKPVEVGVGAGAAVITAFATSYLGTAGTLTGAALASVLGTVTTSVLRSSADRSAEQLRRTTARLRETHAGPPSPTDTRPVENDTQHPTGTHRTGIDSTGSIDPYGTDPVDPYGTHLFGALNPEGIQTPATVAEPEARGRRPRWMVLSAGAVIAFVAALALITGIESAAGKPLAALVGKESGGGTTLGRATGSDGGSSSTGTETTPSPTSTPTGDDGTSQSPSDGASTEPSAPQETPAPSGTTPSSVPSATEPAPTQAPTASPNSLTSESPKPTP
jgi:hypothetical protein